jgi:hypothetical protein
MPHPRRQMYWILDGHKPVPAPDILAWSEFMASGDQARRVAQHVLRNPDSDPVQVSTVFLGLDHNWNDSGAPLLFESMVFGGPLDGECYRYASWDDALAGHAMLVDEALIEGRVVAWEVREKIKALAAGNMGTGE